MTILLYDLVGENRTRPFSPHCWKVAMALAHKGLAFESVPTPFTAIARVEGGVSATVPVIRDGDRVVADSFAIASYLEETYPDRPTLFAGEGGKALSRFIERWSQLTIHAFLGNAAVLDIHDRLGEADRAYFRASREKRYGRPMEEVVAERDAHRPAFLRKLEPLRSMLAYQPFLGGDAPLFPDYIVFGAFQWVRIMPDYPVLPEDDVIGGWVERCLDLHGGFARRIPAAADLQGAASWQAEVPRV